MPHPSTPPASQLLTPEEVAHRFGVTPRMVRHLWATRQLGGVHVGRHVRHRPEDVDDYIARQRVEAVR